MKLRRNNTGMSLVELLSMIMIMGVLAALLIVGVGKVVSKADQTKCASNLRRLGEGIMLFAADHNNMLPPSEEGISAGPYPGPIFGRDVHPFRATWSEYIMNVYLGESWETLVCPSHPSEWEGQSRGKYTHYGFNQRLSPVPSGALYRRGLMLDKIERPSRLILLGDSRHSALNAGMFRLLSYEDLHPRHGGDQVNVLYVDMHVASEKLDMSQPPANDEPLGRDQFVP